MKMRFERSYNFPEYYMGLLQEATLKEIYDKEVRNYCLKMALEKRFENIEYAFEGKEIIFKFSDIADDSAFLLWCNFGTINGIEI